MPRHNAAVLIRTHVITYTVECFTAVTPEEGHLIQPCLSVVNGGTSLGNVRPRFNLTEWISTS